jgi:RNA polymerase sigma factor (sigma-70 family)
MSELDDHQLLAEFARTHSEAAFAALVQRHLNLVYSVAQRSVGNAHAAQEISQAVFLILAQKAKNLSPKIILSGWLYQTTRLTAANFLRGEIRRQQRESEAYMQSTLNEPETANAWPQIAPLLDAALAKLGDRDRNAIVLRFFENKNLREVGAALGASEDAAKMRVNRALEKLRKMFGKRGVSLTAAIIAGAVSANSVQAAPAGLAATITAAKGTSISATLTTLVKTTMKTMTWLKIKFAVGLGVAILIAGGAVTVAVSQTDGGDKLSVPDIAKRSQDTYAALTSYSDTAKGGSDGGGQVMEATCTTRLQRPKQYRVEWTSNGGLYQSKGLVWSDGGANYEVIDAADKFASAQPSKVNDMQMAFASATGVSGGAASTVAGAFFKLNFGDKLGIFATGRTKTKRLADEKISGVDCYVMVSVLDASKMKVPKSTAVDVKSLGISTTTLWIGKKDCLIRKARTTIAGISFAMKFTDESLKVQLERQRKPVTPENLTALRAEMEKSMAQMKKSSFTFTETHENIVVNQKFSAADFTR